MTACVVLIGSDTLLAAWSEQGTSASEVVAVSDADLSRVLDIVSRRQPEIIVLEQSLATSARGAALMSDLHRLRHTRGTDLRLLSPERAASLTSAHSGETHPTAWLTSLSHPLPPRPHRRAVRVRLAAGAQALVDGQLVTLVDVSPLGAQVHSSVILRPNQRVRWVARREHEALKTTGVVVWSEFQVAPAPRYRAGIAFASPLNGVLDAYRPA